MKDINPVGLPSHGISHRIVDIMSLRCLKPPTWAAQERVLSLLRVSMLNGTPMLETLLQARFFGLLIPLLLLGVAVLRNDDDQDYVHQEEGAKEYKQDEVDRSQNRGSRVHHLNGHHHSVLLTMYMRSDQPSSVMD